MVRSTHCILSNVLAFLNITILPTFFIPQSVYLSFYVHLVLFPVGLLGVHGYEIFSLIFIRFLSLFTAFTFQCINQLIQQITDTISPRRKIMVIVFIVFLAILKYCLVMYLVIKNKLCIMALCHVTIRIIGLENRPIIKFSGFRASLNSFD